MIIKMKAFRGVWILSKNYVLLSRGTFHQFSSTKLRRSTASSQICRKTPSWQTMDSKTVSSGTTGTRCFSSSSNERVAHAPNRYGVGDIMKVILTCTAGLTVGAWISKRMVSILEEYELFVLEEDEDDEYDDD